MVNPTVDDVYATALREGRIAADPAQAEMVEKLDRLAGELSGYRLPARGVFGRLFGAKPAPRGLYIHGDVGRGKTFLMDLFYSSADVASKRRVHFHAFMADVHARVHEWRQARKRGEISGDDPIAPLAEALAKDAALLCFDEFSVRDIADAMILGRLFGALFGLGVVVVATSNVAPDDLYKDGLNRALFLPFIALIGERMEIVRLDAAADYRLAKLGKAPVYYAPPEDAAMDAAFQMLTGVSQGEPAELARLGRVVVVPQAMGGVARFDFDALCRAPLSAADYVALAARYETILVDRVPVLDDDDRNAAKRFINFIDAAYDAGAKLIVSAAEEPDRLAPALSGVEAFEFARTASRLTEMRSLEYLGRPHAAGSDKPDDLGGIVDG